MKWIIGAAAALTVILVLALILIFPAKAEPLAELRFEQGQAVCRAVIRGQGSIAARMELAGKDGTLAVWEKSAENVLEMEECCEVLPGAEYTLNLSGSIGAKAFKSFSVTAFCPGEGSQAPADSSAEVAPTEPAPAG
ncbi:MAG: hypothetical protein IJK38_00695, partial [Oscillospiraceae bacterium]|nr:hypothetical protein [Oscillospiraceae bacterium]